MYMMEGLDASYDGVFFVSYHGSMSTSSPLSHTYNPRAIAEVSLNGVVVGESGINALVAQAHDVPVVLVTGDDVTAREATDICPGIHTAVVKRAVTRFAADSLHPAQARELIRSRATAAVASLTTAGPPTIPLPATVEITFRNADLAAMAAWIEGVSRVGNTVVTMTDEDALRLYRRFIVTVILTREIAE
jgi:D-amino peptidase